MFIILHVWIEIKVDYIVLENHFIYLQYKPAFHCDNGQPSLFIYYIKYIILKGILRQVLAFSYENALLTTHQNIIFNRKYNCAFRRTLIWICLL